MTQETIETPSNSSPLKSSSLPDVFSHALMQMVDNVQPSIVQVLNEGRGAGTGIIWDAEGYIITNHHVVPEGSTAIKVHLTDGQILDAKVVDRNAKLDLAMLSIAAKHLRAVTVGDSARLRVGEWVFAVGNPWGQRGVVTAGIVSSVNNAGTTKVSANKNEVDLRYIKSDVVLAPGNSGGPLLNADGNVVGVNAMVFGGDLAVSIPSNIVSAWIAGLPRRRITLGIEVQPVDLLDLPQVIQAQVGGSAKRKTAVLVIALGEDKAGSTVGDGDAGLFVGDVLLEAAGKPVVDEAALLNILVRKEPQEKITLRLVRGGVVLSIDVKVGALEQHA
ncbi:MAG: trypsin-like peptidase domain-containing protein [Ktedonobacteraceae bacterium]